MPRLDIDLIPVLRDNYIHLLHDRETGATAVVDPALAEPVEALLAQRGWTLTHIFNTHHHDDHTGGNLRLKAATGCRIVGAGADAQRLPGLDIPLEDGDAVVFGGTTLQAIATPGHTLGHLCYWLPEEQTLFSGDTLFSLGCGRLFEGSAAQMWASLSRLAALPGATRLYCAHEYTQSNAAFARTIEPGNTALAERCAEVEALRAQGLPTLPSTLAREVAANPFLRADQPAIRRALGLDQTPAAGVFAELRRRKDVF